MPKEPHGCGSVVGGCIIQSNKTKSRSTKNEDDEAVVKGSEKKKTLKIRAEQWESQRVEEKSKRTQTV